MAKHIVVDARALHSGAGRYITQLLDELQKLDKDLAHRYTVLLRPKDIDSWNPSSKRFSKVASRYRSYSALEQFGLAWQLYRLRADLVHFTTPAQPLVYFPKSVTTVHELTDVRFEENSNSKRSLYFKIWLLKMVARKTTHLFTPSEFVKDDLARFAHINSRKISVTNEAGNAITDRPVVVDAVKKRDYIMYLGQSLPHKNLRKLIEAFVLLQVTNPELLLVMAGKKNAGYRRQERYVLKHDIKNVIFTDKISDGELRWLYENTKAYVFPSLSEGFGLPGLEAMTHGAPVISSEATCLPEIYGDAAIYFDPLDTEDIAKKITKVLSSQDKQIALISAGKKRAARYSWTKMAQQTLDIYNEQLTK